MKLHHIAIQVKSIERSRAFYVDVLGLPEIRRQPHALWVDAHGVILMLEQAAATASPPKEPWHSPAPGLFLLALTIPAHERNLWREKLTAAGSVIERESDYTLYFRDPDGTRLGLSSYPEVSRGAT